MLLRYSHTITDLLESASAGRVLSARHTGGEVIGDEDDHIRVCVDAVEKSGDAGVSERTVSDDGDRRMLTVTV